MIALWAFIGVCVGTIMGLTGGGGTIVSVPLFLHLLGLSMAEATAYTLFSVCAGSSLNWFFQRKNCLFPISLVLSIFSFGGIVIFTPIKQALPDTALQWIFIGFCLLGVFFLWYPQKKTLLKNSADIFRGKKLFEVGLLGLFLGFMVTMTGLGGGIVLVPILVARFGLAPNSAVPTSLLTTTISATFSLIAQKEVFIHGQVEPAWITLLFLGTLASAWIVQHFVQRAPQALVLRTRKWALTIVIAGSIGSLFF